MTTTTRKTTTDSTEAPTGLAAPHESPFENAAYADDDVLRARCDAHGDFDPCGLPFL